MTTLILSIVAVCFGAASLGLLIFVATKFNKKSGKNGAIDIDADVDIINQNICELKNELDKKISDEHAHTKELLISNFNSVSTANSNALEGHMRGFKEDVTSISSTTKSNLGEIREELKSSLKDTRQEMSNATLNMRKEISDGMTAVKVDMEKSLKDVRESTDKQLEEMRKTVGEKLESTLNDRIKIAFDSVNSQLEKVEKGFSEVQMLSSQVGDLNKVFSNIKTRGTWGEVALESLLSQILAPEQFAKQFQIKRGSQERVDFVVIMPAGGGEDKLYLPIDAKFPTEDYLSLVQACESHDKEKIEKAQKALSVRIKKQAMDIRDKYISVPKTTPFALMYLPTEGLYAEVARDYELCSVLQNEYKISVCGPTTITALLNSLQMGFTTLKIQKESASIVDNMRKFTKDFATFSQMLVKVRNNASKVVTDLDDMSKRNDKIQKTVSFFSSPTLDSGKNDDPILIENEENLNEV